MSEKYFDGVHYIDALSYFNKNNPSITLDKMCEIYQMDLFQGRYLDKYMLRDRCEMLNTMNIVNKIHEIRNKEGVYDLDFTKFIKHNNKIYVLSEYANISQYKDLIKSLVAVVYFKDAIIYIDGKEYVSCEYIESTENIISIKSLPKKTIYTYLMIDDSSGYYKIGRSTSPEYREKTLGCQIPQVRLLATTDTNIERKLHIKYSKYRVRGEWFDIPHNYILELLSHFNSKNKSLN